MLITAIIDSYIFNTHFSLIPRCLRLLLILLVINNNFKSNNSKQRVGILIKLYPSNGLPVVT